MYVVIRFGDIFNLFIHNLYKINAKNEIKTETIETTFITIE